MLKNTVYQKLVFEKVKLICKCKAVKIFITQHEMMPRAGYFTFSNKVL